MVQGPVSSGGNAFSYEFDAPMVRYTDRDILEGLRGYVRAHGPGPFSARQFNTWKGRPFCAATVVKRFGSWRGALARIGTDGVRPAAYGADELMANLERIWRSLGRRPGHRYLKRKGRIGAAPYERLWGSLPRACRLLAAHHRGEMTREELLGAGPGKRGRKKIPSSVRWRVLKRDKHRCVVCGRSPATHAGVSLELDHIRPVSRGGGDEEGNLRTLCSVCNGGKRDGE